MRILQQIIKYLQDEGVPEESIYYSLENNTLGEAALVMLEEMGEENIGGTMITESRRRGPGRIRKGFTTTHKSKLAACAKLKQWVETDRIEIASKNLLRELKTFVARGQSYAAKEGETDDLVMALLLVVRMTQEVTKYEDSVFDFLQGEVEDDDYEEPMPMSFL